MVVNMKIIYFSLTGNCRRFAEKLDDQPLNIKDIDDLNEDAILVFPTVGFGKVPTYVKKFLKTNHQHVKMVVVSGNKNWGPNFAAGADIVKEKLGIPGYKMELAGNENDIKIVKSKISYFQKK